MVTKVDSGVIVHDGGTIKDALDKSKPIADYVALRAYTGNATQVRITNNGISGFFYYDAADTTSLDNGGTIIVASNGKRWKRLFTDHVYATWFGAKADWNGTTGTDNTAAIQAAIYYAATISLVGQTVKLPPGKLMISAKITTSGFGNVGQVGILGAGKTSTILCPNADFTAINIVTSLVECGDFSVEWPATPSAQIPTTRIGVELASANYQYSNATLKNVEVRYGYRGIVLNDWSGQPLGTSWLCTLYKVTAFRCAEWGFWLNSRDGSTTLCIVQCYVRGDSSAGGQYGKGVFVNNFSDVYLEQVAIDQCVDQWVQLQNFNVAVVNSIAFESNKIATPTARAVYLNGSQVVVNGVKDISCTCDTGGNAQVFYLGPTCTLSIAGYNEQFSTVVAGTTKYRIGLNGANSQVSINDSTIRPNQVIDNGYSANVSYQGERRSRTGTVPNYGTWVRGDYVRNGAPEIGQPKGWHCTAGGSPGTWVSEGNL